MSEENKRKTVMIDKEVHKKLKQISLNEERNIKEIIKDAVEIYLKFKNDKSFRSNEPTESNIESPKEQKNDELLKINEKESDSEVDLSSFDYM